jgi:hypothetical protein
MPGLKTRIHDFKPGPAANTTCCRAFFIKKSNAMKFEKKEGPAGTPGQPANPRHQGTPGSDTRHTHRHEEEADDADLRTEDPTGHRQDVRTGRSDRGIGSHEGFGNDAFGYQERE